MLINPDFPVGNAAGWCKSTAEVAKLAASVAQFIIVGSITCECRLGNRGNTFDDTPLRALNSLGLPNPGIENIEAFGPRMIDAAHKAEKPIILSVAGFSAEEYGVLSRKAHRIGFDGIELNLGCPNIVTAGKRKPIASSHPNLAAAIIDSALNALDPQEKRPFISVKVSPLDPESLVRLAETIVTFSIDAVVTQNTVPNCLDFDTTGRPIIDTPDDTGWAGGSGPAVLCQALGQVSQWRQVTPDHIAIWGVGGVTSGLDVQKMRWAGASVIQVGTAYFTGGAKIFGNLATQFFDLPPRQGVAS